MTENIYPNRLNFLNCSEKWVRQQSLDNQTTSTFVNPTSAWQYIKIFHILSTKESWWQIKRLVNVAKKYNLPEHVSSTVYFSVSIHQWCALKLVFHLKVTPAWVISSLKPSASFGTLRSLFWCTLWHSDAWGWTVVKLCKPLLYFQRLTPWVSLLVGAWSQTPSWAW